MFNFVHVLVHVCWSSVRPWRFVYHTLTHTYTIRFKCILDATPSPMQQFYQNRTVFLTGGTGFLGKVIMEKLLRTCHIDTIYVLIRSKKGKDIATRIEDLINDVVSSLFINFRFLFLSMITTHTHTHTAHARIFQCFYTLVYAFAGDFCMVK